MKLDRIYTRGGDSGETSLGDGARVSKYHLRVETFGALEEANATLGIALLHVEDGGVRTIIGDVQNDLFDVGADLARPERADAKRQPLRITADQVERLEHAIDRFNAALEPLTSFILPGGTPAAAHLHRARTDVRRAERELAELAAREPINAETLKYLNRLSDLLFVLARYVNDKGRADVLWLPGRNR